MTRTKTNAPLWNSARYSDCAALRCAARVFRGDVLAVILGKGDEHAWEITACDELQGDNDGDDAGWVVIGEV